MLTRGVWKLFRIARDEYRDVLDEHAVVDFPDALERALALLAQRGEFTRSRYLLESRYHHLLVDEFQDTSDAQWQLVWHLVQSWREGVGDGRRTSRSRPRSSSSATASSRSTGSATPMRACWRAPRCRFASCATMATSAARFARAFAPCPPLLSFTNDLCAAIDKRPDRDDAFTYDERDEFPVPRTASQDCRSRSTGPDERSLRPRAPLG